MSGCRGNEPGKNVSFRVVFMDASSVSFRETRVGVDWAWCLKS